MTNTKDPKDVDIDDVLLKAADRLIAWVGDDDMDVVRAMWADALDVAVHAHLHPFDLDSPTRRKLQLRLLEGGRKEEGEEQP